MRLRTDGTGDTPDDAMHMKAAIGEFDAFLFSTIEQEEGAAPLSVLSLLARLDLDPWDEAAHLATLPQGVAADKMRKMIASLPPRSAAHAHPVALVSRLIALLPSAPSAKEKPAAVA